MTTDDIRCCGTGTCMINADDICWCGQRWDGEKMCSPDLQKAPSEAPPADAKPVARPSSAADA